MRSLVAGIGLILHVLARAAEVAVAEPGPTVAITRDEFGTTITFSGTLQSAETVIGPWTELTDAASPWRVPLGTTQQFFRTVRAGADSIFSSQSVVDLVVSGLLQEHFDLAFAGVPDGIFPPVRQKPYFEATVQRGGIELPVTLRVRGNSSLQECPFPKLKFKVSKANRPGTPFADAREVKIGTHCAEGGRGNVGRLREERAAFREALAYEVMDQMGFITPRIRRARIQYRDTAPAGDVGSGGWQVSRNAMIFDDVEVVAERLGGRALSDEEVSALTDGRFDPQLVAGLQLFHALLGNWDYGLWQDGRGLWNTEVIELPNQQLVPVAGDFDLASWVTGEVRLSAPRDYHPEIPDLDRQVRYEIEQIRQRVGAEDFAASRERFVQERAAIESQISSAEIDSEGRANAHQHVTAFYNALAEMKE